MEKISGIYKKKLGQVGRFTIWEVNGTKIRSDINSEFTNFGQHYRFPFIKMFEFWIDEEQHPGETRFFIDHLLTEWRYMRAGKPYRFALTAGDKVEQAERTRSLHAQKLQINGMKQVVSGKLLSNIHIRPIQKYSTPELTVWLVNGELVRDACFIDFTEGGHGFVYHFVPKGEVWIDDDLSMHDWKFVVLHELHERALMTQGFEYHKAHHSAMIQEHGARSKKSTQVYKLIEKEKQNNQKISK